MDKIVEEVIGEPYFTMHWCQEVLLNGNEFAIITHSSRAEIGKIKPGHIHTQGEEA